MNKTEFLLQYRFTINGTDGVFHVAHRKSEFYPEGEFLLLKNGEQIGRIYKIKPDRFSYKFSAEKRISSRTIKFKNCELIEE